MSILGPLAVAIQASRTPGEALACAVRVAVSMMGDARALRSVLVPHAPLSPPRRYLDYFGADVRFGGGLAALTVPRRLLDEAFSGTNEAIRAAALEHLARHFRDPRLTLPPR